MTERDLRRILRSWQKRLNLSDWDIRPIFDGEAPEESIQAEVSTADDSMEAEMWFYDFAAWDQERANRIVVHELLHIANRDVENIWVFLDGQLHRDAELIAKAAFRHAVEVFVDRQSRVLVSLGGAV